MYRRRHTAPSARRGVILLVVVLLLTLFAIVGLSFVLYAESEANASRMARDAESLSRDDVDPEVLFSYFMGQLVYGVSDTDGNGVYSALRGHDLARLMYGYNSSNPGSNNVPFNGVGRLHYQYPAGSYPGWTQGTQEDDFFYVNYAYFSGLQDQMPVRDPERLGPRASPTASQNNNPYTGGFNVPYTYPDLNNMFLAWVDTHDPNASTYQQVMVTSFHRDTAAFPANTKQPGFNYSPYGNYAGGQSYFRRLDPRNPNWYIPSTIVAKYNGPAPPTDPRLKYWVLRPRPVDQLLGTDVILNGVWPPDPAQSGRSNFFPPPEDEGGDVKNLIGAPGGNDSMWIDLGAPVLVGPDGKKYKALFAPLILDLDSRININATGNLRAYFANNSTASMSHQGWGPWEINLGYVLPATNGVTEWPYLFIGNQAVPNLNGRYGPDKQPGTAGSNNGTGPANVVAHFYGQFDFDGADEANGYAASGKMVPPGTTNTTCWPVYNQGGKGGFGNASAQELAAHPGVYNSLTPTGDDRTFPYWDLEAVLRFGDTGAPSMTSELLRLLPNTLSQSGPRRMITTHSFDWDRPGFTPWIWDPTDATNNHQGQYQLQAGQTQPSGNPMAFPSLGQRLNGLPQGSEFGSRSTFQAPGSYNAATDPQVDWRGTVPPPLPNTQPVKGSWLNSAYYQALSRIDLNRALPPYPNPDATTGRIDWSIGANQTQFNNAQQARQLLAQDIFQRLLQAAGTPDPNAVLVPTQLSAARWLAQLAVNIVDYIDSDDYMTPFPWYTDTTTDPNNPVVYYVFGTELPRVVVNETYVNKTPAAGANPDIYDVWVELLNPFNSDGTLPNYGSDVTFLQSAPQNLSLNSAARLLMPAVPAQGMQPALPAYGCYQLALTQLNPNIRSLYQSNPNKGVVVDAGDPDAFPPTFTNGGNGNFMTTWTNPTDMNPPAAIVDFTELLPMTAAGDARMFVLPNNGQKSAGDPANLATTYWDPTKQNGYYVIGPVAPQTPLPGPVDPMTMKPTTLKPTMASKYMSYRPPASGSGTPTVMLRRLACPNLPPNDPRYTGANPSYPTFNPALPLNPYISVDYQEDIVVNNLDVLQTPPALTGSSVGRLQPYGAARAQQKPQTSPGTIAFPAPPPSHSFFQQNSPSPTRGYYNWLIHLDRQLISPMEVLQVSAYRPHELTQQFVTGTGDGTPNQQTAPWTTPQNRIYRALEFLRTANRAAGVPFQGRVPGLVNINTMSDLQVFQALCDAQNGNSFADATDVQPMFNKVMAARTTAWSTWSNNWQAPNGPPTAFPYSSPFDPVNDKPFLPLSTGHSSGGSGNPSDVQYPNGISIENTLLRSDPTDPNPVPQRRRLFDLNNTATQNSPYLQKELFNKIFNNLTTRSNVFAVWVTVGFFEVIDDTTRPVKLGAEIGRAEGRNIRHRMFAIVDRSVLTNNPGPQPAFDPRIYSKGTESGAGQPTARVVPYYSIIQ
jgi:hypothetical protein